MSLDNVLAVAGAARAHPGILVLGLLLSVALMGIAANLIARYIERYRWIAYVGLLVILVVAVRMIHDGLTDPTDRGVVALLTRARLRSGERMKRIAGLRTVDRGMGRRKGVKADEAERRNRMHARKRRVRAVGLPDLTVGSRSLYRDDARYDGRAS